MKPSNQQLEDLRAKAASLLPTLSASRPLFVEFAGTPKSGKSTCIDTVHHFFRRVGYKVLAPTEGASRRTPYYLKNNLVSFNTWSATYALTHILEGRYSTDKYHLAILDRGLFDALAWFELLKAENTVTEEECTTVQNFLLVNHWREVIDIVFLFVTDPDTSLERETRDKLIEEPGQAMNPEFLKKLNTAYEHAKESYSGRFRRVRVLDTSKCQDTTPQSTAFEVASQILDLLPYHKA